MSAPTPIRAPQFLADVPARKNVTSAEFNRPRPSVPAPVAVAPAATPPPAPAFEALPAPMPSAPLPLAMPPPPAPIDDGRLRAAIEHLKEFSGRLAEQARSDALEIGFQVARKILEAEVTANPAPLFGLIRSAVQRLGETRKLSIHLAPNDLARIEAEGGITALGLAVAQIELLPDSSLTVGDCIVDSDLGRVDGRLATRLAEVQRAVAASEDAA